MKTEAKVYEKNLSSVSVTDRRHRFKSGWSEIRPCGNRQWTINVFQISTAVFAAFVNKPEVFKAFL